MSLGALCFPASIQNFQHSSKANFTTYNLRDLLDQDLNERACYCFAQFFQECMIGDPLYQETECFGISVVYDHQLRHAIWLANAIRAQWPDKLIFLGGTSISQSYKYLKNKEDLRFFFDFCDAIIVGEGESAVCQILSSNGDPDSLCAAPNTITLDRVTQKLRFPAKIHYEDVASLGSPLFEHEWDLYLSPVRGINYAPTRGCYWNRCTFCDYGLNVDSPTSPWRERKIEQVILDLAQAVHVQGVRYVYFAVDVMAPGYLERLADAIIASGLELRWSAELRMEKIFSPERCRKMALSGCVCASFGMESGNQRILDLIDKGTKVEYMAATMKNFAEAGIAVQLMTFTGFPTETPEEKQATYNFIQINKDHWSAGGTGTFLLTGNAIIARKPEKFGITLLETKRDDIKRALDYRLEGYDQPTVMSAEDADASFHAAGSSFPTCLGRPWAGGTDTLHSMVYYEHNGRHFFKLHPVAAPATPPSFKPREAKLRMVGDLLHSAFEIGTILKNRRLYREHTGNTLKKSTLPTYWDLAEWQKDLPRVERLSVSSYWMTSDKAAQKLDRLLLPLLERLQNEDLTEDQLLANLRGNDRLRATVYLDRLIKLSLLSYVQEEHEISFDPSSLIAQTAGDVIATHT